jgi:mannose-6-phosphate isomerase-like protein (cupin superfamily)
MKVTMSEFFEPDAYQTSAVFFKPHELRDLITWLYTKTDANCGRITLLQEGDAKGHGLQILYERYEPGADTGETMLEHIGNEGGVAISGEIEVTVAEQLAALKAGDCYLFDSNEPHRFRNVSDRKAVVVSACTPTYLWIARPSLKVHWGAQTHHLAIRTSIATGSEMRHSSTRAGLPPVISMICISAVFWWCNSPEKLRGPKTVGSSFIFSSSAVTAAPSTVPARSENGSAKVCHGSGGIVLLRAE